MTITSFEPRVLRVGQLLDQAMRFYRRNFLKFVGIVAIVQVPLSLLLLIVNSVTEALQSGVADSYVASGTAFATAIGGSLLTLVLSLLNSTLIVVASAAIIGTLADQHLGNPSAGILTAYQRLLPRWRTLVGVLIYAGLLTLGLVILMFIPCVGFFGGLGAFFFYSAVVEQLMAPVVVLEQQSARGVVRRAWDLARNRFWPLIGFVGLLYLLNLVLSLGPTLLFSTGIIFSSEIFTGMDPLAVLVLQQVTQTVMTLITTILYIPLQSSAIYSMYIDLRVRAEGLDLAWKAQGLQEPTGAPTTWPPAPAPEKTSLITGTDFGNFFMLSLAVGALFVVLYGGIFAVLAMVMGTGF